MRDTAGIAAAPAARCRNFRRGSFMMPSVSSCARKSLILNMMIKLGRLPTAPALSIANIGTSARPGGSYWSILDETVAAREAVPGPMYGPAVRCKRTLSTPHSITSLAIARRSGGTVRPRAFAVFRLMTRSKLVGCMTGRSAGTAPLRMRPVYRPHWWNCSGKPVA
jgi:hypothetical protein